MKPNLDIETLKQSNLSAATIKVRDAVIQKCEGKDLDEMTHFIKQLLENETNEQKRLGVLAARVYLLREKIAFLLGHEFNDNSAGHIKSRHGAMAEGSDMPEAVTAEDSAAEGEPEGKDSEWMRVRILEDAEVNHVRFPAGVVIDAMTADAQKLIEAGKAETITSDDGASAGASEKDTKAADTAKAEEPATDENADAETPAEAEADNPPAETTGDASDGEAEPAEAEADSEAEPAEAEADSEAEPAEASADDTGQDSEAAGDDAEKS